MTFDTAFERSHPPNTITTPPQMDWQQVALNGGPPCFFVEGPQFCGRAERWQGHGNRAFHDYVSLDDLLTTVRKEARVAAFRECAGTAKLMAAGPRIDRDLIKNIVNAVSLCVEKVEGGCSLNVKNADERVAEVLFNAATSSPAPADGSETWATITQQCGFCGNRVQHVCTAFLKQDTAPAPPDDDAESLPPQAQLPSPAQQALQIVTAWRAVVGGDDLLIHYIKQAIEENCATTTTKGDR